MRLEVVQGKKGPKDKVVLITANREPLKIEHLLWILQQWFESEEACYPQSQGYEGKPCCSKPYSTFTTAKNWKLCLNGISSSLPVTVTL